MLANNTVQIGNYLKECYSDFRVNDFTKYITEVVRLVIKPYYVSDTYQVKLEINPLLKNQMEKYETHLKQNSLKKIITNYRVKNVYLTDCRESKYTRSVLAVVVAEYNEQYRNSVTLQPVSVKRYENVERTYILTMAKNINDTTSFGEMGVCIYCGNEVENKAENECPWCKNLVATEPCGWQLQSVDILQQNQ